MVVPATPYGNLAVHCNPGPIKEKPPGHATGRLTRMSLAIWGSEGRLSQFAHQPVLLHELFVGTVGDDFLDRGIELVEHLLVVLADCGADALAHDRIIGDDGL